MPRARQPLFLARANYRKRRLRDGARLVPIFGLLLLMLPLLWPSAGRIVTVHWAFVFVIWAALICMAAALSAKLVEADRAGDIAADTDTDTDLPPPDSQQRP